MIRKIFLTLFLLMMSSCGWNLYKSLVSKNNDHYRVAQAEIAVDKQDYDEALSILQDIDHQSNESVLLKVAATLGSSGLSMWDLIKNMTDADTLESSTGSGADRIFNLLDDNFFGTGEVRIQRLKALSDSLVFLNSAPDSTSKIENVRCFLAGILAFPTVSDGQTVIAEVSTSLTNLQAQVIGTGATAAECPNLSEVNTSFDKILRVQSDLVAALSATASCPLFATLSDTTQLNEIQRRLTKFNTGADKGCVQLTCNLSAQACAALQFGCIQNSLDTATAGSAPNGSIETCEVIQNCGTGACF